MFSVLVAGADSAESTVTVFDRFPPASSSACVAVCEQPYTQVSESCSFESAFVSPLDSVGAAAHFGSATVIPVSVTLPVFVTVNVYGIAWPGAVTDAVVDDLTTWIDGRLRDGDVERARRRRRLGRVRRDRVRQVAAGVDLGLRDRVRAAVHPRLGELQLRVGVRVAGREHRRSPALRIQNVIPVRVTLPVFVTVNVYGTTWPAASPTRSSRTSTTVIDGACATGMFSVLVSGADSAESAVTVFERFPPASTSACVTVWYSV